MIYSIVSMDDIFYKGDVPRPEYRRINGGLLELGTVNGEKRIQRLYSTDPYMYLDPRFCPCSGFSGRL